MTETGKPKRASPTASEYIGDNFKPSDRIAVLVLNRNLGEDHGANHDCAEGG